MTSIGNRRSVEDAAQALALANRDGEPNIIRTYLFPSSDEIRLIHVDTTSYPLAPDEDLAPFYFAPDPSNGIDYWVGIALIRPEDEKDLTSHNPPAAWGKWDDAKIIWERI